MIDFDIENDYTKLRPFDLRLVSQGDRICDTHGREVSIDAATEILAQLGPSALRMLPEMWLDGLPVYRNSELAMLDGSTKKYADIGCGEPIVGWPVVKPKQVVEVYVDGRRVGTDTIPGGAVLVRWDLHYTTEVNLG